MAVTESPPAVEATAGAPVAVAEPPAPAESTSKGAGRQGRRERDRAKDGGRALIDAFTMQQRRNARPRGEAAPTSTQQSPPTDAPPAEPVRLQSSPPPPPRLPRGSRAAAHLDRVRGARAAAAATSPGPRGERVRGASDGPGDRVYAEARYDPEFDRGEGGQADDASKGRGRGKPVGQLFDPETDFVPPRRVVSEDEGGREMEGQRSLWSMPEAHHGPPPPHGPYGPPPPPPHHFHHGFGPPPPPHHHRGRGAPPFHPRHYGPPHHHGPPPPPHHHHGPPPPPPPHHRHGPLGHHGSPPHFSPPAFGGPHPYEPPFGGPPGHPPYDHFPGPHPRPHSPALRDPTSANSLNGSSTAGRQLYDPRRDDPVRFGSKRSKADSASGSAVSKSKKKDKDGSSSGKSKSSKDSKDGAGPNGAPPSKAEEESRQSDGSNSYVKKLKTAYKVIADLEKSLKDEEAASRARDEELKQRDRETGRLVPSAGGADTMRLVGQKRSTDDYWVRLAKQHQQLAEAHRQFLDMALDPRLPESLHSLPQKYNIPVRLWQTAFHQLLERLRHALPPTTASSLDSTKATESNNLIEHMVDFIYYAYGFYTGLLSEPSFSAFRSAWIEQLGDLARYRMAVASLSAKYSAAKSASSLKLPLASSSDDEEAPVDDDSLVAEGVGDAFEARIDEDAKSRGGGSIGVAALNDWEYEEQETWRNTARDWYAKGLAETPAVGRLHHHLALLSKGDELKALYHYVKSLTAPHPYLPARESVLPFFEAEHQTRRTRSEVSLNELFVHLHGMLFTKIQLDDFDDELARFLELLAQERLLLSKLGVSGHVSTSESCWIMMAVVNVSALLQYGADDSVLGRAMSAPVASSQQKRSGPRAPASRPQAILLNPAKKDAAENAEAPGDGDVADDVVKSLAGVKLSETDEDPLTFRLAARLCFSMLDEVLRRPLRPSISGTVEVVSPYVTIVLTFLGQVGQRAEALRRIERFVPWPRLVSLFNKIPRDVEVRTDQQAMRLAGAALPEDWCMRGMDWAGRTMFARGYFKPKGNRSKARGDIQSIAESEMDALNLGAEAEDDYASDGVIEADGDVDPDVLMANLATARWRRIALVAGWAASPKGVSGLAFDPSVPKFAVLSSLRTKISRWKDDAKVEEEAQKAMLRKRAAPSDPEADEVEMLESDEEDADDEEDSEAVKALKSRRRELRAIIRAARAPVVKKASTGPRAKPVARRAKPTLDAVPGYTVLVFDTNILVGMLSIVKDLLEARRWTLVIPLAVVTELDGLKVNPPPLGKDASDALRFLETSIRDGATRSQSKFLKVQTSRGNYLHDLSIRSEEIDFSGNSVSTSNARNMDDLVLRAAIWQNDHFSNRLAVVNPSADRSQITSSTAKVALVTFDRNLRLKAHARGIAAADEKDIARLLAFRDQG